MAILASLRSPTVADERLVDDADEPAGDPLDELDADFADEEPAADEPVTEASALRAALAAAKAEIAHAEEGPAPGEGYQAPEGASHVEEDDTIIFDGTTEEKADPKREHDDDRSGLDPDVRYKLKMLRRLNPNKSTDDLLRQIGMQESEKPEKKKKRWFGG